MSELVMSNGGSAPGMQEAMAAARRALQAQMPGKHRRAAPAATAAPAAQLVQSGTNATVAPRGRRISNPLVHLALLGALTVGGLASVFTANRAFLPEMYDHNGMVPAAEALASGKNYAVFDLNINIRRLRDEQVARMTETPDVVVLGASHWQEAHAGLMPGYSFYNSHIHRDFWEDLLAMGEIWTRHNRLPKKLIISIRDNQFRPIEQRPDFLWEPGIPYYRAMADRLGLEKEPFWVSLPYHRFRERLSLSMLFTHLTRWYNAGERPHPSNEDRFESLDTLLPDGSILWSKKHIALFTPERAEREAIALAELRRNDPPPVEARGVAAFEKLLEFYKSNGVTVYFAQPPFNPIYWDRLQGSPYMDGLAKVDALTRDIARRHGIEMIGGFDPHKVGCTADMYIDAEHGSPACLKNVFDEFIKLDRAKAGA